MAGNARFHDKHHRTNHHTLSTVGIPDSATDPIASPSQPFQGDFVVNGVLSSSKGLNVLSANYGGDVYCENLHIRDTTYTDFISGEGTETIISDGALTGYVANTLTLDFGTAIYAKTPIANFTNSISAASAIYTSFAKFTSLSTTNLSSDNVRINSLSSFSLSANYITSDSLSSRTLSSESIISNTLSSQNISANYVNVTNNLTVSGNCLIYGNLSALGDLTEIETILHSSSSFRITNTDISSPALKITQSGTGNIVLMEYDSDPNFLNIDKEGLTINGKLSALSGIYSPNITLITSNLTSNSANWNSTYSQVSSNSANWISNYSTVSSNSANWNSVYSSVSSNSANWNSLYSTVSSNSANWVSTYSTVSSNSGNWNSAYSSVSSNSANWSSAYTTVSSNSASWLSGNNTLQFDASSINTNTLSANILSANIVRVFQAIHVSVSSVSVAAGTTTTMTVNSPSYFFVTVTTAGTANFNLPATNGNNRGMIFYVKNVSTNNNHIVNVNNSAGTPLTNGVLNGNAGRYIEVVWDGTTWQEISHI